MTTRITGLYSGLDVDSLVEAGASYYQNKVNTAKQTEQKLEWQQEQYRTIQSDVQTFYDKYLSTTGEDSLMLSSNWNTNSYTSSDSNKVSVSSASDASTDSYTVSVTQLATATQSVLSSSNFTSGNILTINNKEYKLSGSSNSEMISNLNTQLTNNSAGITASYSSFANNGAGGLILKSDTLGAGTTISASATTGTFTNTPGTYLHATITDSSNNEYIIGESGDTGVDKPNYTSNSLTLDGVTFNFTGKTTTTSGGTTTDSPVTVTGTKDVSDVQDKIESFMDDYNTLMKTINGKIYETYDKSYQPLTDSEKSSMTDSQITKWETKAQTGLLRHDSYLEKLADDMKSSMSSFFKNAGIDIESIGISAVDDYTTKNGTYTVDSDKLKSALEGNTTKTSGGTTKTISFDDIKNLFTNGNASITSFSTKNSDTDGILSRLKVALNTNATMTSSELAKRAGIEGTTSETTNEITQLLKDQDTLVDDLEEKLSDKEDALYSKYSKLETSLSSLESSSSIFSSSS